MVNKQIPRKFDFELSLNPYRNAHAWVINNFSSITCNVTCKDQLLSGAPSD